MNGVIFVIYAWCAVQVSSSAEKYKTNEGIGFPLAVNLKEGVSGLQILSRNRRDDSKKKKSYLFFDNRSERRVELWWTDKLSGENEKYTVLWPGETYEMFSYTTHHWRAVEKTKNRLLINNETEFAPQANQPKNRTILIIRRPDQTDTKIREKFIETMVVVDRSVIALHGSKEDVTRYVLTLLRMATKILQHQKLTKLGVKLTHVLSKLVLLNEKNEPNFASKDGKARFVSVCHFMNELESRGSDIFDQKIFLTKDKFSTAGFSYHYGMCNSNSNCALIFNNGFSSSIYIAHETGHLLGMDDQDNLPQVNPFVMSSRIHGTFNNHDWCTYSQIDLLKTIRRRDKSCLDNKPAAMYDKDFPFVHKYPGVHFNILKQCQLIYNKNYTISPYTLLKDQCKLLRCKKPTVWPYTPVVQTDRSLPLDGSECGTNKWCLSGVCQTRTELIGRSAAIDGNWGEWKAWKPCSRTCGSGTRSRERECNNPLPRYGGNVCVGIATEARVCNTAKKCPDIPLKEEVLCSTMGAKTERKRRWGAYDETKVNLNCSFESGANTWCNWKNLLSDQQDWELNKGKTGSSNTGPSEDHTKNTDQGQYIYFESSSPDSEKDYTARLSSPKLAVRQACLSFWYHMFGNREMGTLRVIHTSQGASKTLWTKTGDQKDKWHQAKVEIQDDNLYQIFFEAEKVMRGGYHSDIALDDITFTPGACDEAGPRVQITHTRDQCTVRCTTIDNDKPQRILLDVPIHDGTRCHGKTSADVCYRGNCTEVGCDHVIGSGKNYDKCKVCGGDGSSCKNAAITKDDSQDKSVLDCGFNNDLCQWNITKNYVNDLRWLRKEDTSYNQGYYLYMETSSSQLEKKYKARIVSPKVSANETCLSFYYLLNGDKIGRLRVMLTTSTKTSEIWFQKGSQGDKWKKVDINIERNSPYKVVIEAVVKNRQHGEVAIDNIQFRRHKCP